MIKYQDIFLSLVIYLQFLRYMIILNHLIFVKISYKPTKTYLLFSSISHLLERLFKYLEKLFIPTQNVDKLPCLFI